MTRRENDIEVKKFPQELPTPKYLLVPEILKTYGKEAGKWIGVETLTPEGKKEIYLWWRNLPEVNFQDKLNRYSLASFAARIKLEVGADVIYGHSIDFSSCNPITEMVKLDDDTTVGVYIKAEHRPIFNFKIHLGGVRTEEELRKNDLDAFKKAFQEAQDMLPYPRKTI